MRTFLILSALTLALSLASCAKKYSCKCTTTITAQYYYPHTKETVVRIDKRVTKKKAQKICDNTAVQLRENTKEIIRGWDIGAACVLKDY
jgi:hypothetical protein